MNLPAEVEEYLATLTALPKGLALKEQWNRAMEVARRVCSLCRDESVAVREKVVERVAYILFPGDGRK